MDTRQTNAVWKKLARRLFLALGGMASSFLCVMGYYPLVPAFYAACCVEEQRGVLLYIGLLAGMGLSMPAAAVIKYLFVLLVLGMAIRFYLWTNRRCSGWTAAVIAGFVTAAMNLSGTAVLSAERRELVLGISEGAAVFALAVFLHRGIGWVMQYVFYVKDEEEEEEMPRAVPDVTGRLHAFAEAMDGLSAAFSVTGSRTISRLDALEQEVTGKLCAACDGCAVCQLPQTGRIRSMLAAVAAHSPKEEILRRRYVEECPHYSGMVEEAVRAFSRMELNEAWYRRLQENRRLIAAQLDAMADTLQEWDRGIVCIDGTARALLARIRYETRERGLCVQQLHIYEDREKRRSITALVGSKWGGGIPSKNYRKALEKATGMALRLQKDAKSILTTDAVRLTAYEDTCFYALSGVAAHMKDGSGANGDSFSMFLQENGHYCICLSDGMGSGLGAQRESDLVVGLTEKLMEAGFERRTAIGMMNSAMVLKGENESYSTLDLADIDLYRGEAQVTKIGAAASFVLHRGEVSCLRASTLPAGADSLGTGDMLCRRLVHGDFLVMVTDGVLEYLHVKDPEEKLSEMIAEIHTENAGAFADALLEHVLLFTGGRAPDDMTIIVTGIWEK